MGRAGRSFSQYPNNSQGGITAALLPFSTRRMEETHTSAAANCSSSVDPAMAVVVALPAEMTLDTSSK